MRNFVVGIARVFSKTPNPEVWFLWGFSNPGEPWVFVLTFLSLKEDIDDPFYLAYVPANVSSISFLSKYKVH